MKLIPKTPLAVMVYIHGGAFVEGSSSEERYGPDYLLQKNVVIVTLNYRLGAMGNYVYLCSFMQTLCSLEHTFNYLGYLVKVRAKY